jgi:hypothetical protein
MTHTRLTSRNDTGAALISSLLILVLMAGLTAGLTALVITDTRVRMLDNTRTQSFYVAHAGLEKLTADLGDLFSSNFAPTGAQINALTTTPPALGAQWLQPDGSSGYTINFPTDASGNPAATAMTVLSGPFQGLVGLATPYQMTATARLPDGSEASLTRTLQTVAIPVFQFGIFSENDLSFFAGPDFNFGGRVHSNSNVFLAAGSQLTVSDKITAVGEIIRTTLSNGWPTSNGYTGNVRVPTAPGAYRDLAMSEGSLVGGLGTAQNEPTWTNLSTGTYNHNIANGRTGAKQLELPIVSFGAQPIDLIRRPVVDENLTNPNVLSQRFYELASLRILLSDTAADISTLPDVTATPPVQLGAVLPAGFTAGDQFGVVPNATTHGHSDPSGASAPLNTPVMGGYIKIEEQTTAGVWQDVTMEILNLGIAGRQLPNPTTGSPNCLQPDPDAIIRLERIGDHDADETHVSHHTTIVDVPACLSPGYAGSPYDYVPNAIYDAREGIQRDNVSSGDPMRLGGIMYYVELDVKNLSRWFAGAIGVNGPNALNVNGFTVYFSDRRGNVDAAGQETGEYGFEDIVNPASGSGAPDGVLETGEDFNGNNQLDVYGETPHSTTGSWTSWSSPLTSTARPWTVINSGLSQATQMGIAERNPAIFFRRALKLTNGSLGNITPLGLTIASENPVYVEGDWNASTGAGFGSPHAATAILADAVTLLSNSWNDRESIMYPHNVGQRPATSTWYRFAVIAGKGISFPYIAGNYQDYGTDGGAHNFLRYLENWGGQTVNFRGSIASLFTSRQAVGTYKCCNDVYSPPTRGYNFDSEFLTPSLLPPRTPMFRDVNTTGFAQIIRPN